MRNVVRVPLGLLTPGTLVWSAGQLATVGAVEHVEGSFTHVELWHVGASRPERMAGSPDVMVQTSPSAP